MFLVPVTRSASDLVRNLDRLLDGSFDRFSVGAPAGASVMRKPALDVAESEQAYTVTLDLPGVSKDDVHVSIEGRRVSIEAKSSRAGEHKDGDRLLVRERAGSSYARSFVLAAELDQGRSSAKLEHGVLTLELAKQRPASAQRIAVN